MHKIFNNTTKVTHKKYKTKNIKISNFNITKNCVSLTYIKVKYLNKCPYIVCNADEKYLEITLFYNFLYSNETNKQKKIYCSQNFIILFNFLINIFTS